MNSTTTKAATCSGAPSVAVLSVPRKARDLVPRHRPALQPPRHMVRDQRIDHQPAQDQRQAGPRHAQKRRQDHHRHQRAQRQRFAGMGRRRPSLSTGKRRKTWPAIHSAPRASSGSMTRPAAEGRGGARRNTAAGAEAEHQPRHLFGINEEAQLLRQGPAPTGSPARPPPGPARPAPPRAARPPAVPDTPLRLSATRWPGNRPARRDDTPDPAACRSGWRRIRATAGWRPSAPPRQGGLP
ncbi:MAG: hypothetical protein KatS3mg118_3540 [Paracoccaceae bacterium]|nr:MAG: hypothetical protein KatS3mg118_3540 [Paracoccaceae bacterium]